MFNKIAAYGRKAYNAAKEGALVVAVVVVSTITAVAPASAASVLDTATLTDITGGFTDMKDTLLGLLGVAWPFLIAVPVIMMAPRIVSKIVKMIGRG